MDDFSRILIDTNICLDVLLSREPYRIYSQQILTACENSSNLEGYLCSLSYSNIFYLLNKDFSAQKSYTALKYLAKITHIASVTDAMVQKAISEKWPDFEDAIQHQCALFYNCEAIITRNAKDFMESEVLVFTPLEFLNR